MSQSEEWEITGYRPLGLAERISRAFRACDKARVSDETLRAAGINPLSRFWATLAQKQQPIFEPKKRTGSSEPIRSMF